MSFNLFDTFASHLFKSFYRCFNANQFTFPTCSSLHSLKGNFFCNFPNRNSVSHTFPSQSPPFVCAALLPLPSERYRCLSSLVCFTTHDQSKVCHRSRSSKCRFEFSWMRLNTISFWAASTYQLFRQQRYEWLCVSWLCLSQTYVRSMRATRSVYRLNTSIFSGSTRGRPTNTDVRRDSQDENIEFRDRWKSHIIDDVPRSRIRNAPIQRIVEAYDLFV